MHAGCVSSSCLSTCLSLYELIKATGDKGETHDFEWFMWVYVCVRVLWAWKYSREHPKLRGGVYVSLILSVCDNRHSLLLRFLCILVRICVFLAGFMGVCVCVCVCVYDNWWKSGYGSDSQLSVASVPSGRKPLIRLKKLFAWKPWKNRLKLGEKTVISNQICMSILFIIVSIFIVNFLIL